MHKTTGHHGSPPGSTGTARQRPAPLMGEFGDELFRAVANYTYDWESWHAPDGRLLWVNPTVERATGHTVAECMAMADYPLPLVDEEDRPRLASLLKTARGASASGENFEFRCLHRRGEIRWMSLCWQSLYDHHGRYAGFRTSVRDITEKQALRDQLRMQAAHLEQLVEQRTARLRQLEKRGQQMEKLAALGELAAGVAHEINNPLAGMRSAFELIRSTLSPDHKHYEMFELIDREIERISGIVHQMYQLYRHEPQPISRFGLPQMVDEVARYLSGLASKQQVTLRYVPLSTPAEVLLAQGEVKQILFNLMRNAIQASPPRGEVTVHFSDQVDELAVHVDDSGPGVPEELLPRIFEPFFTTKQGGPDGGLGLGLSVSRSLIEAMGGRIEVTPRQPRGCRFSAVFPHALEHGQEDEA